MDTLYLVVPCYNEEEVLPETSKQLRSKMLSLIDSGRISGKSHIVFVDDGSSDRTWEIISELHRDDTIFQGIRLSRNNGHQNALLAGLMTVKSLCDMTITLDADLQDDIEAIDEMIEKYYGGCDIVYGVRNSRDTDTAFKRKTAEG
ncbi:MAG: glycosyltransferase family 2 protein, partial [Oscillospiraceae bacterium]|nr:glycosyltransferase family 2 protein [Oscillospiraceae bacterium]